MNPSASAARYDAFHDQRGPGKLTGLAVVAALHAGAILFLLQYEPARKALADAMPIMVSLITPVAERPVEPPKPLPVRAKIQKTAPDPAPVLAAPVEAPAPAVAPPLATAAEPVAAPAPVAPPVAVTPPNFNADYLRNPPPAYPYMARRQGQQGKVILRVLVSPAGLPGQVEIRTSSGVGSLDDAALDAVRNWRFVPARQGTQAVAAWVLVPIAFTLER